MPIPHTYRVIGKIGAGNSGEIYKAYQINLGKYVVLKKIKTEIKDFLNNRAEVDVLKNLRHSCLPQVLDFFEADGDVYTVMDFIPGNSFKDYLDSGTVFEEKSVIIWAKQIAATLGYLHSQKPPIIHSDLKPGTIMLTPEGNICLIHFCHAGWRYCLGNRIYQWICGSGTDRGTALQPERTGPFTLENHRCQSGYLQSGSNFIPHHDRQEAETG